MAQVLLLTRSKAPCSHPFELGPSFQNLPVRRCTEPMSFFFRSWEQGTAAGAIIETDNPEYSVFGTSPFSPQGFPASSLQLAFSAAVRQTSDGRLSQQINDALDGAALDGASAGSAVLLGNISYHHWRGHNHESSIPGTYTDSSRKAFWQQAADAQLNFVCILYTSATNRNTQHFQVLNKAPRTSTGAISHRIDSLQYW